MSQRQIVMNQQEESACSEKSQGKDSHDSRSLKGYGTWVIGRVAFPLLDLRPPKSSPVLPKSASNLGKLQVPWLHPLLECPFLPIISEPSQAGVPICCSQSVKPTAMIHSLHPRQKLSHTSTAMHSRAGMPGNGTCARGRGTPWLRS